MMEIAETSSLNGDAIISPDCVEELKKPGRKKRSPLNSRFAEPCSSNSEFQATPHYDLDVEDASFVLRKLENAAFQAVVDAFRTQGPLTPYKELLLEHLRFALFIREHDFVQVIQEAADNVFFQKVCKNLNPSSSCSAQWRALSFPAHTPSNAYIRSQSSHENRTKLMTTIGCHNVSVKDLDVATAKLCSLKKERYIPQQLRRVLYDTELSAGRVDCEPFDITEDEMRRDFIEYENEKERIANEMVEDERGRSGRHRRGKKRKATVAPFHNHTVLAQSLADEDMEDDQIMRDQDDDDDVVDEEEQCQAEAEMMKLIETQDKIITETKEQAETSPNKHPHKVRKEMKKKLKESTEHGSIKSQSQSLQFSSPIFEATPSFSVATPVSKPPPPAQIEFIHPTPKHLSHNRTEEQRAMDEDLVLVKTAQAMIEDLENTAEPENGLSPTKRKKQKHDGTPKKRGRKPAESKDNPITCARTTPFVFDGKSTDPNKAPRGNPDKKAKKHIIELKSPVATTNGVAPAAAEKPAPSPPASQPRLPAPPAPKTAIIPVSPATIVIRPRNPTISTSPSTSIANVTEISPVKKMRFTSEGTAPQIQGAAISGPVAADPSRVFPLVRQAGRPTMFRPPNVVFPRSASVLNNGVPRYSIPFTTQSSGNPTGPYYGNPSFSKRATLSRDRPQLHTFTRPPTSVIRLVTSDLKSDETISNGSSQPSTSSLSEASMANGMRPRSTDLTAKAPKEGETLSSNILSQGNIDQQAPYSSSPLSQSNPSNSGTSLQFSTSFPPTLSTQVVASSDAAAATQMISIRHPHFPLSAANIPNPAMINLQAVTISSKPTSSLYQVVNAPSQVFMQNVQTQIVQTAIPVMLHTVATSNFTPIPAQPSMATVPMRTRTPSVLANKHAKSDVVSHEVSMNTVDENLTDIPLPSNQESDGANISYSSNESFDLPPPPPPPPDDSTQQPSSPSPEPVQEDETSETFEKTSQKSDSIKHAASTSAAYLSPSQSPRHEVIINGVDPHISASIQSMIDRNHFQPMFSPPPPPPLSQPPHSPQPADISESHPIDESQNPSTSVSQPVSIENSPANT